MKTDWWQTTFPQGQQTLTIDDARNRSVRLAYGEKGRGRPMILVHGLGSWSYSWRHNLDSLAQEFRTICFDAKGYGFSEKPTWDDVAGHQVVELERFIRTVCEPPAIVVAESLGALAALALAQRAPELFERLVLLNVPIFPKDLPSWGMQLLAGVPLELIRQIDRARWMQPLGPLFRQIVSVTREEVVVDASEVDEEDIYWLCYPYIEFPGAIAKFVEEVQLALAEIQQLQRGAPSLIRSIQSGLAMMEIPTLVLWGDRDRWFPVADGKTLHRQLPNASLQVIPNCGHKPTASSAATINTAILSFAG